MSDNENRPVIEFERLNLLGKAAFLSGSAVRLAASFIDSAVHHAADIYVDAERAFKQGRDPNIEDAKVIDETND